MADIIAGILDEIFIETDLIPELIIPTLISDLPVDLIAASVAETGKLVVIEEGSAVGGIGSEVISSVAEFSGMSFRSKRISGLPVPIPSVKSLENIVIPNKERIIEEIRKTFC
jgi:pyruvate/2-oxoglutarate/acetoin dehydrogenase E1 component